MKIATLIFVGGIMYSCGEDPLYPDPMTPEESMATFQLDERFEIQLVAAEPVVMDPVSIRSNQRLDQGKAGSKN